MKTTSIVQQHQEPLIKNYLAHPEKAWITDVALINGENLNDPFHTTVLINEEMQIPFAIGVHRALGGLHDQPNSGDLLCAALASCFDSTLRMIANRFQVQLQKTKVKVMAEVDVRASLCMTKDIPVGFQKMTLNVELEVGEETPESIVKKMLGFTEYCCIVYQTIKQGIPVELNATINAKKLV